MNNLIEDTSFKQSCFKFNDGCGWDATTLVKAVKEDKLIPFALPLAGVDIGAAPWKIDCFKSFVTHAKRVENTDLKYPIILDDTGYIIDGWHRVAKALIRGDTTIQAVRMIGMPKYDYKSKPIQGD